MLRVRIPLRRCMFYTTLCDKVCQCLATGRCLSLSTQISSNNKTDRHEITEILLKFVLSTITITPPANTYPRFSFKKSWIIILE
jgi:hypothetical protein